ncbi:hypothetical protein Btru_003078 [Bulinus truncatus]|nr:hypothetical protein Btru_003078 [Bulinus truncatus]
MSGSELSVTPPECLHLPPAETLNTPLPGDVARGVCGDKTSAELDPRGTNQGLPIVISPADKSEDEDDEITETKIIGVTETGVIRKRSFKRKLTKEEKMKRQFGNDKADYEAIYARIVSDRFIVNAVEMLQERWKMLSMMHTDCQDMMVQWERRCQNKRRAVQVKRDVDTVIAAAIISVVVLVLALGLRLILW